MASLSASLSMGDIITPLPSFNPVLEYVWNSLSMVSSPTSATSAFMAENVARRRRFSRWVSSWVG